MGPAGTLLLPFFQGGFVVVFALLAVIGLLILLHYSGNDGPRYQCRGCSTTFETKVAAPVCPACGSRKLYLLTLGGD